MGKHETITADIDEALAAAVRDAVAAGDYDSVSDVVRHALTEWGLTERRPQIGREQLQAMLDDSLEGPGLPAEQVFDRLIAKYEAMAATEDGKA